MVERDLRLGFRALSEGIVRPDHLCEAMAESLRAGGPALPEILESWGLASPEQLADLGRPLDWSADGDHTASLSPDPGRDGSTGLEPLDATGSTASLLEPSTRPWKGLTDRTSRPNDRTAAGGRYERIRVHGVGGLGRVWLARDLHLGREVALKELRDDRPIVPGMIARFLQEARITSHLQHPGIVPVFDMVEEDGEGGLPFYTMRFLAGRTLGEAVESYHGRKAEGTAGILEFRGLLDAFTAVCQAVAYAHARDVLHRDLKGKNILLGDFGEVFVIDWGLAKTSKPDGDQAEMTSSLGPWHSGREETVPGSVLGTPGYIAPELLEGAIADRRSDVYSLGAILYLILTGRVAYSGEGPGDILELLQERDPEPPRTLAHDSPLALEAICLKAMAREPRQRYGSAAEMAEEIRRFLADEPVEAYPDPPARRLARVARKRRATVLATSAAMLSALVIQSIATAMIWREQEETVIQKAGVVRERHQAETNLILARQLTSDLVNVAENELSKLPRSERARTHIFDNSLLAFRNLLSQKPTDPFLRSWTARIGRFSANQHQLMNELKPAESTYLESIALQESLAREAPGDFSRCAEVPMALVDHARAIARLGRLREAAGVGSRSIEIADSLVLRFPERTEALRVLAFSLDGQAAIEGQMGHLVDSVRLGEEAIKIYEDLLVGNARGPMLHDRLMLGSSLATLAMAKRELGEGPEGLAIADQGVMLMRSLLEDDPQQCNASDLLAAFLLEKALAPSGLEDRYDQTLGDLGEAIKLWDKLAEDFREFYCYQEKAAEARRVRGTLRAALGLLEPADEDLETSRQAFVSLINRFPEIPGYHANLGRTYLEQARLAQGAGRSDRARERLEQSLREFQQAIGPTPENGRDRTAMIEARDELTRTGTLTP